MTALRSVKLFLATACAVLAWPLASIAQTPPAGAAGSPQPGASVARTKPTAAEKRCLASRRRVERQHEATAEAEMRVARERSARESCKSKRVCDNLDRALNASEARRQRHEKRLAQFDAEAKKACAGTPAASLLPGYRSNTAASRSPATTNTNSTR